MLGTGKTPANALMTSARAMNMFISLLLTLCVIVTSFNICILLFIFQLSSPGQQKRTTRETLIPCDTLITDEIVKGRSYTLLA
ncbi:MAG: hypothetical protein IJ149_08555, partial [Oscillospiraceae bacterium]|nr:hypothetical protein [Oscillospiraceae bacterium]